MTSLGDFKQALSIIKPHVLSILLTALIIILSQAYITQANSQGISIVAEQINAVQRALLAYLRVHPEAEISPLQIPSIETLVQQGYLAKTDDITTNAGSLHLYTVWDGEISVQANHHHLFIHVEKLPHITCQALLAQLRLTAPQAACWGEVNDPMDWQLQIPLGEVKLFAE